MIEMEMESHGTVRIIKRHKTTGQSLWHVPLSARSELHSHPLAEQAQACGRLTKAEGPEGPMAPIVTTGGYSVEKTIVTRHPCTGCHANLLRIVPREKTLELCVSSLCQDHACLLRTTKKSQVMRVVLAQVPCRSFTHSNYIQLPSPHKQNFPI